MFLNHIAIVASLVLIGSNAVSQEADSTFVSSGLELLEKDDVAGALAAFVAGFDEGESDAGFYVGRLFELGAGVEKSPARAAVAYEQASDAGSALAKNRLGLMSLRGEPGVLQDFARANQLVCESADLGYVEGEFNCAELKMRGVGEDEDIAGAVELYEKAAEQGHIGSYNRLGAIFANEEYEGYDLERAVGYFEKAAERGNANGLFEYANALEQGVGGVEVDLVTAHVYFNIANIAGHPGAPDALARVGAQLDKAQLFEAQEAAKERLATLQTQN